MRFLKVQMYGNNAISLQGKINRTEAGLLITFVPGVPYRSHRYRFESRRYPELRAA